MKRHHLFEFEDQPWLPATLRDTITDVLSFFLALSRPYDHAFALISKIFRISDRAKLLDLCSGSGAPARMMHDALVRSEERSIEMDLSDKFPNKDCQDPDRQVRPFDVLVSQSGGKELRTMFSAFHHFQPFHARRILANSVDERAPIAIFEFTQRSLLGIAFMIIGLPIIFLCSPFIRPFKWSRIFWVYVVPAAPLVLLWDGIVSAIRTYTPRELITMTEGLDDYYWQSGIIDKGWFTKVTYLTGIPHENVVDPRFSKPPGTGRHG